MNTNPIFLHDNRHVRTTKGGAEFFAVTFREPEPSWIPYTVSVSRYCLPGRIQSYQFEYIPRSSGVMERVGFCSEGGDGIDRGLRDLRVDLDRPQIVEMLVESTTTKTLKHARTLALLLDVIAPKSKSLRAVRKAVKRIIEERKAEHNRLKSIYRHVTGKTSDLT